MLHAIQHYMTKYVLNGRIPVTLRLCLSALQLFHLTGRQLYLAIPWPARSNCADIAAIELKACEILDARWIREAADSENV